MTRSVSTQNGTQDFFQYVQSITARGYSVHYATAAVLMLRYCGVPARYAEGYYLSGQDAASGEQTFELDETHAPCVGGILFDRRGLGPV